MGEVRGGTGRLHGGIYGGLRGRLRGSLYGGKVVIFRGTAICFPRFYIRFASIRLNAKYDATLPVGPYIHYGVKGLKEDPNLPGSGTSSPL